MKKLKTDIDAVRFLQAVAACQGEVTFETQEGDVLNLKSMLTMYLFAAVAEKKEIISAGCIRCALPEDFDMLTDYLRS